MGYIKASHAKGSVKSLNGRGPTGEAVGRPLKKAQFGVIEETSPTSTKIQTVQEKYHLDKVARLMWFRPENRPTSTQILEA